MKAENTVRKELLSYLVQLEEDHQDKVLHYIKHLLGEEDSMNETVELNRRAELSEKDIENGRTKPAETFRQEFKAWQKKKRTSIKS